MPGGGAVARARAHHRAHLGVLVAGGRVRVRRQGQLARLPRPTSRLRRDHRLGRYPSCPCSRRRRRSCPRSRTPPSSGRRSGGRRSCSRSPAGSARSPATPHQPTASQPSPGRYPSCPCRSRWRRSCPRSDSPPSPVGALAAGGRVRVRRQGQLARLPRPTRRLRREQRLGATRRVLVLADSDAVARARTHHRVQDGVLAARRSCSRSPAEPTRSRPATPQPASRQTPPTRAQAPRPNPTRLRTTEVSASLKPPNAIVSPATGPPTQ